MDDVRRILTLLCFSARPLTINELLQAHAVDLTEPAHLEFGRMLDLDGLQDICLGLIEMRPSTKGPHAGALTAHIAHYSVQEYLESDRIRKQRAATFYLQRGPSHAEIAQICLVYLLEPHFSRDTLDEQFLSDFPLARFAAMYWHNHYTNASDKKVLVEHLVRRLYNHPASFAASIRLHDPANPRWNAAVNRPSKSIGTPLFYASFLGLESLIDELVASGSDLNKKYGPGSTPLHAAAQRGHEKVVQMLLDRGATTKNPETRHSYNPPLQLAAMNGHRNVVQLLLDRGVEIDPVAGRDSGYGLSPLGAACQGHQVDMVQYLLSRGANIHTCGEYSGTALHAAARAGYLDLVQLLVGLGADIHAQSKDNGSVFHSAVCGGSRDVVEFLLDRLGNEVDGGFGRELCTAASLGRFDVLKLLLDRGADVNERGGERGTALQYASYGDEPQSVEIVELLLDRGADVNAPGGEYGNPLQNAILRDRMKIQEILLAWGAKNEFD